MGTGECHCPGWVEIHDLWKLFDHPEFKTGSLHDACRIAMKSWWNEYHRAHPITVTKH